MTFSTNDWQLSERDLAQLDAIEVDLKPYSGEASHVPFPPLKRGVGNANIVDSGLAQIIRESEPISPNRQVPEQISSSLGSGSHEIPHIHVGTGIPPRSVPQSGRFFRVSQLATLPAPTYLIQDILPKDVVSMLFGPPASLKSFLALDWMLHLAIGKAWNGHPVVEGGMKVLYLLGEGKNNLFKRIEVWKRHHHLTPEELTRLEENFLTSFVMPQVRVPKNINTLINDMNNEAFLPTLIVFDTFARSFVGSDDSSSQETGEAMAQFDRLRDRGHTILFIHHTIKNVGKKGQVYRGSLNLEAAVDTAFDVYRNKDTEELLLRNSKQKDDEELQPMKFGWKKIFLDLDQKMSSLVLVPITDVPAADQILAMPLPLSRGDILKQVKGVRRETVIEILDQLLVDGQLVESKVGRFKMIDKPKQDPNAI